MTISLIIALLVAGILLVLFEVLVVPGLGIPGLLGGGLIVTGTVMTFISIGPLAGTTAIVASGIICGAILYIGPKTPWGQRMILKDDQTNFVAHEKVRVSVGDVGVAVTPLRPAGLVRFGDIEEDVVTAGEFVESETNVRVDEIEGGRIVVRSV